MFLPIFARSTSLISPSLRHPQRRATSILSSRRVSKQLGWLTCAQDEVEIFDPRITHFYSSSFRCWTLKIPKHFLCRNADDVYFWLVAFGESLESGVATPLDGLGCCWSLVTDASGIVCCVNSTNCVEICCEGTADASPSKHTHTHSLKDKADHFISVSLIVYSVAIMQWMWKSSDFCNL